MARGFRPIIPKRDPFAALVNLAGIRQAMSNMLGAGQRRISTYPTPQTSYRRTGTLGKLWTVAGPSLRGKDLVGRIGINLEYAIYVQGKKQISLHKRHGWRKAKEIGEEVMKEHIPYLQAALRGV